MTFLKVALWVVLAFNVVLGTLIAAAFVADQRRPRRVAGPPLPPLRPLTPVWAIWPGQKPRGWQEIPPEPSEVMYSPDPVVGFRSMRVDGNELVGHNQGRVAGKEWVIAQCPWATRAYFTAHHGPVPGWLCMCGFYAHKHQVDTYVDAIHMERAVVVVVHLAGRVIEHETGYRAERMRVVGYVAPVGVAGVPEWLPRVESRIPPFPE